MNRGGAPVHVKVLGQFEVRAGDDIVDERRITRTGAAVLKLLAIEPAHVVRREVAADALWPRRSPASAANALYKALHHVRTALGDHERRLEIVTIDSSTLALADDVAVDVDAFRHAAEAAFRADDTALYERALDCYPGDLLPDDPYEPWAEHARDALRGCARRLRLEFGALLLERRCYERVRDVVAPAFGDDAADERAAELLMRAHTGLGNHARALDVFERCSTALAEELGLRPDDALRSVADRAAASAPIVGADVVVRAGACTTVDGHRIRYESVGEGPPLVRMSYGFTDLAREWEVPAWRSFLMALADGRTLLRYEGRGAGASAEPVRLGLDTFMADLDAVVDANGIESFDLFGAPGSALGAIAYAAAHADRVRRLVLWSPHARGCDVVGAQLPVANQAIVAADWGMYARGAALLALGYQHDELVSVVGDIVEHGGSPDYVRALLDAIAHIDVSDMLPGVTMPTLVLHGSEFTHPPIADVDALSAALPDGRLVILSRSEFLPWAGDATAVVRAIRAFLDEA